MTASKISPDGVQRIERIDVNGRSYDLPNWMSAADFAAGLQSEDDEAALAALTGCEFNRWEENEDYDAKYPADGPQWLAVFDLTWFVPFGSVRELVAGAFTPEPSESWPQGDFFEVEFTAGGAVLRGRGREYRDINDVQVFLVPGELMAFEYVQRGEGCYLTQALEEFKSDPAGFLRYATGPEGQINLHVDPSGVQHMLVVKIHED